MTTKSEYDKSYYQRNILEKRRYSRVKYWEKKRKNGDFVEKLYLSPDEKSAILSRNSFEKYKAERK